MTLLKDQPKEFLKRGFELPTKMYDRNSPFDTYDTRLITTYTKPVIANEIDIEVCFLFEINEANQKVKQLEAKVYFSIDKTSTETTITTVEELREFLYSVTQIENFLNLNPCKPNDNP